MCYICSLSTVYLQVVEQQFHVCHCLNLHFQQPTLASPVPENVEHLENMERDEQASSSVEEASEQHGAPGNERKQRSAKYTIATDIADSSTMCHELNENVASAGQPSSSGDAAVSPEHFY